MYYEALMSLPKNYDNADLLHQRVWKHIEQWGDAFKGSRNFLFRTLVSDERPIVLVRTNINLKKQTQDDSVVFKESALPETGDSFMFVLTANPAVNLINEKTGKKLRKAILDECELQAWLGNKSKLNGFQYDPTSLEIIQESPLRVTKKRRGQPEQSFNIHRVTFQGKLRVTQPELFEKAMLEGIGRSKAYGCGMLMLFN